MTARTDAQAGRRKLQELRARILTVYEHTVEDPEDREDLLSILDSMLELARTVGASEAVADMTDRFDELIARRNAQPPEGDPPE